MQWKQDLSLRRLTRAHVEWKERGHVRHVSLRSKQQLTWWTVHEYLVCYHQTSSDSQNNKAVPGSLQCLVVHVGYRWFGYLCVDNQPGSTFDDRKSCTECNNRTSLPLNWCRFIWLKLTYACTGKPSFCCFPQSRLCNDDEDTQSCFHSSVDDTRPWSLRWCTIGDSDSDSGSCNTSSDFRPFDHKQSNIAHCLKQRVVVGLCGLHLASDCFMLQEGSEVT